MAGTLVAELCREHSMSNASFYKWRSRFAGIDVSMMTRLKELEDENRASKRCMPKSGSKPRSSRKPWQKSGEAIASKADGTGRGQKPKRQHTFCLSAVCVSESCYRYQPVLNEENDKIAD